MNKPLVEVQDLAKTFEVSAPWLNRVVAVSYTHLTLPTNREV